MGRWVNEKMAKGEEKIVNPTEFSDHRYTSAHCPLPATHAIREKARAFTLIELLIVLLLMGIIYGIAFNTALPGTTKTVPDTLSFKNIDTLFKSSSLYRASDLILYGTENGKAYLTADNKILETVDLPETGSGYRLNPDETLQRIDYPHIKIGSKEIRPIFSIRCRKDGLFDPQIILSGEKWLYIHPYDPPAFFDNPVEMIDAMRQSAYLPDRAGYAQ